MEEYSIHHTSSALNSCIFFLFGDPRFAGMNSFILDWRVYGFRLYDCSDLSSIFIALYTLLHFQNSQHALYRYLACLDDRVPRPRLFRSGNSCNLSRIFTVEERILSTSSSCLHFIRNFDLLLLLITGARCRMMS